MRTTICVLFFAVFGLASSASAKEEILMVSAPVDDVYTAALRVVKDMEFEIKSSDRDAGLIQTQHKSTFGEANHFLDLEITKVSDHETKVLVNARKRRLSVSGGSPDDRLKQFRVTLSEKLGDKVTVVVKK